MKKFKLVIILVLSFVTMLVFATKNIDKINANSVSDNAYANIENSIEEVSSNYDQDTNSTLNVISFVNYNDKDIYISDTDITLVCTGTGVNKEDDEYLVENGMKLNVTFSDSLYGERTSSYNVVKGEKVYVFINSVYESDYYPSNDVNCNYSLNISYMQ